MFNFGERYRLELHWDSVSYATSEGVAHIYGGYFSGPVLKIADKINDNDSINLDFGEQFVIFIKNYYMANLSWSTCNYEKDRVYLNKLTLTNKYINSVPKLNDRDSIVIDTSQHDGDKHMYTLNYRAYMLNPDGDLYVFGGR